MKLTVSRMAAALPPEGVGQEVVNKVVSSAATNLAATMQILGVSKVSLGVVRSLTCESHVVSSYDFFDGVPDGLKKISHRVIESVGRLMSGFGIGSIEMQQDDGDDLNLHAVWESMVAEPAPGGSRGEGSGASKDEPPVPVSGPSETIPSRTVGCDQKAGCSCRHGGVIRL